MATIPGASPELLMRLAQLKDTVTGARAMARSLAANQSVPRTLKERAEALVLDLEDCLEQVEERIKKLKEGAQP